MRSRAFGKEKFSSRTRCDRFFGAEVVYWLYKRGERVEQVLYGDVLLAVNFSMDFLCLYLTGRFMRLRMRAGRLALGAALGALYGLCAVFWEVGAAVRILAQIAASAAMAALAFGIGRRLGLYTAVLWVCGGAMGGLMTGLYTILGRASGKVFMEGGMVNMTESVHAGGAALLAAAAAGVVALCGRAVKGCPAMAEIRAESAGKVLSAKCMVDSGNLLSEPYTGYAVIVLRRELLLELVPGELKGVFGRYGGASLADVDYRIARRVKLIAAEGASGSGILTAYLPDRLWVNGEEKIAYLACGGENTRFAEYDGIAPSVLC